MEVHYIGDIMKTARKSKGMTQEQLAEEVCSVLTLSRIENGRQDPGKRVYKNLMEKMGQDPFRAYVTFLSENIKAVEYQKELGEALNRFEYKKAKKIFLKLEKVIDKTLFSNQYMKRVSIILEQKSGKISAAQARGKLEDILELTIKEWREKGLESILLSEQEILILSNIADTYLMEQKSEEAIQILEFLEKKLKNNAFKVKKNIYIMILYNLAKGYRLLGKHWKAIESTEKGIALCKENQCSENLIFLLCERVWNMEHLLQKRKNVNFTIQECEEILRKTYYIAVALERQEGLYVKKHYEKYYNKKLH